MTKNEDKINELLDKAQRYGCLLAFLGELVAQSTPASSHGYNFTAEALEGFSYLCLDLGFDLLTISK